MFIKRDISSVIKRYRKFPVVAILGPRQSGKTTLAKHTFSKHTFVDLDNPATKQFALKDPTGFLRSYENEHGIIIDEFQNVPELLSYIKIIVDEKKRPGYFVITGSQNFLINEKITESLAGRVGILTLLPLSINELQKAKLLTTYENLIIDGSYPRIYSDKILHMDLYPSYIQTYIEKDVRQLSTIIDLNKFQLFLTLCAGRIGQILNISDIAISAGIDQKTVNRWLSILEASYILFRLQPYYKNFNKRLTQSSKLFFYDTGIASYLLGIKNKTELFASSFKGALFENLIIADFYKQYYNTGKRPNLYFWRDQNGVIEVDCIIDKITSILPIEIKSSETISNNFFNGLHKLSELSKTPFSDNYLVYAGELNWTKTAGHIVSWKKSGQLIKLVTKI